MLVVTIALCLPAMAQQRKGEVFGVPTANIRGGPGVEHPIVITLKEGDSVTIEGQLGDWYQVVASEGQKGFVHRNLVKVSEEQPAVVVPKAETGVAVSPPPPVEVKPPEQTPPETVGSTFTKTGEKTAAQPAGVQPETQPAAEKQRKTSDQAPSILQLLEGREGDMQLWAAIALAFFIIGWICGGNYYLRRERRRRGRLRF